MFAALLDTCVLWPSLQRDVLLSLAIEGLYRPVWSSAILAELAEHEAVKLTDRRGVAPVEARERAHRLVATMREAFDDAEVEGWEGLDGTYGLPDPDDEHLVAAAVVASAGVIVTLNLKDLPRSLVPDAIDIQTPAEFAHNTVSLNPPAALRAIAEIARRHRRPPDTVPDILTALEQRYGFADAVTVLRQFQ